jgi:hypothetical protein
MKLFRTLIAWLAFALAVSAYAQEQDKPGAVAATEVDAVVTVRSVDQENRTVTVEGPNGRQFTFKVPEQAQNLDQVTVGSKFRVRYVESVAIGVAPGDAQVASEEPSATVAEAVELAPKGATPGGLVARVLQITAKVESIDQASRMVVVRGPNDELREFRVGEEVERLSEVKPGDTVVVRFTEGLAMEMIAEQ